MRGITVQKTTVRNIDINYFCLQLQKKILLVKIAAIGVDIQRQNWFWTDITSLTVMANSKIQNVSKMVQKSKLNLFFNFSENEGGFGFKLHGF